MQITKNTEQKKLERKEYEAEGKMVREKLENERLRLENIKKKKLDYLKEIEIPGKYNAELMRKKIV